MPDHYDEMARGFRKANTQGVAVHMTARSDSIEYVDYIDCTDEDLAALLRSAVEEAEKERDFQWWQELVCVDIVPPTPEAAKKWQIDLTDHVLTERNAEVTRVVRDVQKNSPAHQYGSASGSLCCDEILKRLGLEEKTDG